MEADHNRTGSKDYSFLLLFLLLSVFMVKSILFSSLFPIFQGPDEPLHYATIQRLASLNAPACPDNQETASENRNDIATYNFSEELIASAIEARFDEIKWQETNTQYFGEERPSDDQGALPRAWCSARTTGEYSVYYTIASRIESLFNNSSVIDRFFLIRLLSASIAIGIAWFTYAAALKTGFSLWQSLIVATLVVFQPMLSVTAAIVNIDIALIFSFSLFVYAALSLLRDGLRWSHGIFFLAAIVLAVFSKGPGIILAGVAIPLCAYLAYRRFGVNRKKFLLGLTSAGASLVVLSLLIIPHEYIATITNSGATSKFNSPAESLMKYVSKTIDTDSFLRTEASYWGNFGWLDTSVSGVVIRTIFFMEIVALIGIILYLLTKKPHDYLPEKKYIIFCLGIVLALQFAIRFYDWRVFDTTGQIFIGTPGRYFLPNIIPHILLLVAGLGFFTRNKKQFNVLLKTLLVFMTLFSLYAIIDVIIPRYYL